MCGRFFVGKNFSALDARIRTRVENPRDSNRDDGKSNQHVESGRDHFKIRVSPAENFRDKERAVSGNGSGEARD